MKMRIDRGRGGVEAWSSEQGLKLSGSVRGERVTSLGELK
jgi:hypothetical protein